MPALVGADLRSRCYDLTSAGQAALGCSAQAKLLEHNVRFGDPECQCLMVRLESDLLAVLLDASEGRLAGTQLQWSSQPALTVVMAARGYPGAYAKGTRISSLDAVSGAKARGCQRRAVESFGACRSVPDAAWCPGLPCRHQHRLRRAACGQRRSSARRDCYSRHRAAGADASVRGAPGMPACPVRLSCGHLTLVACGRLWTPSTGHRASAGETLAGGLCRKKCLEGKMCRWMDRERHREVERDKREQRESQAAVI